MNLTEKLIYLRKKHGLTQQELAEKLHISRQAVSRWEVGDAVPGIDNLKLLAALYGIQIDDLLNHEAADASASADNATTQRAERTPAEAAPVRNKRRKQPLVLGVALLLVLAAALLIGAFVRRNQHPDEPASVLPLEDMSTGPEDGYAEGVFVIH